MTYSMHLNELLHSFSISSADESEITSLCIDSRKVTPGAVFFAYPGGAADGRDFIQAAVESGASAIVYEALGFELLSSLEIPSFPVQGLQAMVGFAANSFYREPSSELQVFGVTGTNGKTTCCYLLAQAFTSMGMQAAMMGTIGVGKLDALYAAGQTTPDPISVHRQLAEFRDQAITQVCMEVSSHALDQGRVNGVQFFCSLFTNLSHDHLDYHGDMQAYAAAKRKLFTDFPVELLITNANDAMGFSLVEVAGAEFIVAYGDGGDVYADEVLLEEDGIKLIIEGNGVEFQVATSLVGKVNIPNIEMLVATLLALSTSIEDIQTIVAELKPPPGRMELFTIDSQPRIVVDYAHTPDALEKALLSIRQHCKGELWCVFGCGGDRDRAKRPVMGAAAEKYADRLVITNDNPRSESGAAIAEQIIQGIEGDAVIVLDRREAIVQAIAQAKSDDWVLIAGKGHESTQQVGAESFPFSDREVVSLALVVAA
ncbi:MAG: UDP-N-acetylmuramoyl-L-alanyl-D-glutamate--2,6-diaminopimelate ligase [Cryomorphaceae bacterium]|jgi:UDP-N-acetylmuramoyl-L-alanyl-D-glutamate--2,6-diaminopimelate ligase